MTTQTAADVGPHGRSSSRRRSSGPSPCSPSGSATSSRRSTTCSGSPIAETVFEPRVGGHIYDRGVDGSECRWARVLVYEPPHRVVFSWDISPQWQIETDPDNTSEVEVRFIAEAPDRTRVELEHRNLDRHGPGWEAVRDGVARRRLAAVPVVFSLANSKILKLCSLQYLSSPGTGFPLSNDAINLILLKLKWFSYNTLIIPVSIVSLVVFQ